MVFLTIARSEKLKHPGIDIVADCFQDHVVTFLDCAKSNVFHSLDEGKCASVSLLGLLLEVHVQGTLVVYVITAPELHTADPSDNELRKSSPHVRFICKEL